MSKIAIYADSCSSITKELIEKYEIRVIPTDFYLNDEEFNPTTCSMDYEEFYQKLEDKISCKTSCINPDKYIKYFENDLKNGYDIIHITLSSGLSSSYNNAILASNILKDDYKDNKVEIVDSLSGSLGLLAPILEACKLKDEGLDATEIKNKIDKNALNQQSLFTIGSLDHLRRGGRLSLVSSVVGSILHINPVVTANNEGKLEMSEKHRGRKKAINSLIEHLVNEGDFTKTVYIAHTNCKEEALEMKEKIINNTEFKDVFTGYIDYTMGCHCGPKTIAIFYIKKSN